MKNTITLLYFGFYLIALFVLSCEQDVNNIYEKLRKIEYPKTIVSSKFSDYNSLP